MAQVFLDKFEIELTHSADEFVDVVKSAFDFGDFEDPAGLEDPVGLFDVRRYFRRHQRQTVDGHVDRARAEFDVGVVGDGHFVVEGDQIEREDFVWRQLVGQFGFPAAEIRYDFVGEVRKFFDRLDYHVDGVDWPQFGLLLKTCKQ